MNSPVPDGQAPGGESLGDWSGRVLAGRYELGQLLGTGGMAEVYAAVDRRLGRTVAVKLLRPDLARDPKIRRRFRREAQSAASLNHPSVVAVHDTGDDATEPFIVMEHVAGPTLRDVMRRGEPMPLDQALQITAGVLTALELAHRAGIVHRDIKPGNVMLTPDGLVKVMDFGIAQAMNDDLTLTQTVVGTPAYLSPEHAEGIPVDARSDLYSTGCVLFEMLTGRPPFVAESAYVVAVQHIQEAPPVPSTFNPALPPALDQIVAKALVKDRDARYQTAEQFRADLEAVHHRGRGRAFSRSSAADHPTDPIVLDATAPMPAPSDASPVAGLAASGTVTNSTARPPVSSDPSQAVVRSFSPASSVPAGLAPDGQDLDVLAATEQPAAAGRTRRRWWLWAAAAAALLVVGGVASALIHDNYQADADLWDVFDPSTLSPPSDADLEAAVVTVDTTDSLEVLDTSGDVRVLDPVDTIGPETEP